MLKALIAPHAGYVSSGPIAASAYSALGDAAHAIERVVLIGPSHYVPFSGLAVSRADAFETPLGAVRVDDAARRRSEEHTSELQSPCNLVCRLLLEKKKTHLLLSTRLVADPALTTVLACHFRDRNLTESAHAAVAPSPRPLHRAL